MMAARLEFKPGLTAAVFKFSLEGVAKDGYRDRQEDLAQWKND